MKKIGVAIHAFVGLCILSLFRQFRYTSVPDGGKNGRALNLVQTIVVEPQSSDGRNNVNPAFTNATVKNLRTIVAKEAAATTATVPPTRPAGTPRLSNTTSLKEMGGLAKTYPTLGGEGHGSPSSLLKFDNLQPHPQPPLSKVEKIIQMLEDTKELLSSTNSTSSSSSPSAFRYYVYDHPNITQMYIRNKAKSGKWTWRRSWGQRFKDFALWEIRYIEALEQNNKFRTYNASQADFIVIPIPISALITAGYNHQTRHALETLYAQHLFQSQKQKHVFLTFAEPLFNPNKWQFRNGLNAADYEQLRAISVATVDDFPIWGRIPGHIKRKGFWLSEVKNDKQPITSRVLTHHGFAIQWMGAATDPEHHRVILSKTAFDEKKNYFFYHTTTSTSVNNSTQFRHAPTHPHVVNNLLQPSSVGFDVSADEWMTQFQDSKFCLVIRGDMPGSRSMWRAIKSGCIPVIISDVMPYWAPIFRSLLDLDDYAVLVDEMEFLRNPAQTLNWAISNLTDGDIEQKIAGLNLMQRLILPNVTDSLFVEAFGHEVLVSQTKEYYDVAVKLYGEEHQVSLEEMAGFAKTYPMLGEEGQGSQSSLLKFDNSTACGLQQEVFMEKSLTLWFKDSVPLISSVVGIPNNVVVSTSNDTSGLSAAPLSGDGGAKTRTYHIQILTPHLKETRWFEPNTWFCNNHNKYPATLLTGGRKLPDHPGPNPIRIVHCTLPSDETLEFLMSTTVSSRGIQPTYDLRLFVSCDQVRAKEEQFILQRQVQEKRNDTNNNIHTMHACAQFMGNFSRLALGEWIEYHYMVGFDHIWLYINEPWSLDYLPQRPYVTYIPNNYKLTPEHYPFFEQKVEIDHFFQKMQQNECLYRAKRMNIEWMTVHDTDEFIVLDDSEETKKQGNMPGSSLTSPTAAATSIKEFLALFVSSPAWNDKYGAVQLNSIPFGRNPKKEDMNVLLENRLLVDWTWRSNMSLAEYPIARYKVIVRPINVHYVNIHYIHSGKQPMLIPANVLRLHHYKNADKSVFQASKKLGLLQDSWFRQRYRDNITQMLWGERTYIPVGYHVTPRNFTSGL